MASLTVGRRRSTRSPDEVREAVLDAAETCFRRYGIAQTTIDDVVREAKVSRPTLYRHAGGKEELLAAIALRELDRFLADLARAASRRDDVAEILVDATLLAVKKARAHELFALMLAPDSRAYAAHVMHDLGPTVRERLAGYVEPLLDAARAEGILRPGLTTHDAVEWLGRVIASLIFMPEPWPRTNADRRAFLHRVLVPAFLRDPR
ncbi:MAG: TetR/AcrR family transcriptional regulator [Acidimicrobiales bacterium]